MGEHAVYFNRGTAGSQTYASLFSNRAPAAVVDNQAFVWLSRGLEEALMDFVNLATDSTFALYVVTNVFFGKNVWGRSERKRKCMRNKIYFGELQRCFQ